MIVAAIRGFADAIAPPRCAGCDAVSRAALCEACVERLERAPLPAPRWSEHGRLLAALDHGGPARQAIHAAKYGGRRDAIRLLAAVAAGRLAPLLAEGPRPAAVVPVPLGRRRRRARGFNQAEIAAGALAAMPFAAPLQRLLVRSSGGGSQVGRSRVERLEAGEALEAAFDFAGPRLPPGATVWLVDDVLTTGTTLAAATRVLQRGGASRIEAVAMTAAPR